MTPFRDYSDNELFSPTFGINRPAPVQRARQVVNYSKSKLISSHKYRDGSSSELVKSKNGKYSIVSISPNETTRRAVSQKTLQGAKSHFKKYYSRG